MGEADAAYQTGYDRGIESGRKDLAHEIDSLFEEFLSAGYVQGIILHNVRDYVKQILQDRGGLGRESLNDR